jgi:hypothetical protein
MKQEKRGRLLPGGHWKKKPLCVQGGIIAMQRLKSKGNLEVCQKV